VDIASLGLSVETAEVAAAAPALDKLAAAADRAGKAELDLAVASQSANAQVGSLAMFAAAAAKSRADGELAVDAALRRQNVSAVLAATQTGRTSTTMGAATLSAKQYAQALRLLPAQITDIVTGLASGQSPFIVAIQQGGQLRDSFGGFGVMLRAVAGFISPVVVGIGGIAAVAAVLAKAFNDGQKESFELYKSIVLSGDAAGVTAGQLALMATQIDHVVGTRAQASAALAEAVSTGQIQAENLQQIAEVALRLQKTVGTPVQQTVKEFAALGDKPVQAAEQLQKKYNFLTTSIYDQIRALEREGDTAGAAALAQKTLADTTAQRVGDLEKHLGVIPRAWNAIAGAAKEAWDAMLDIGRKQTPEEELQKLLAVRAGRTVAPGRGNGPAQENPRIQELRAQIAAGQAAAAAAAKQAEALQSDLTQRAVDKVITAADAQTSAATLQSNLSAIKRALDDSLAAFASADQILEIQHKAHLVTEAEYYDARRALIEADRVERVKALQAENALLLVQEEQIRRAAGRAASQANDPAEATKVALAVVPQIIALEEKRKNNLAEMARIGADAATKTVVANAEEKKGLVDVARGYEDARAAAQAYLDTLARRQKLELEGVGAGSRQREINASRSEIEADFQRRRESLERDLRRGDITKPQFDEYLKIEREALDKSLKQNDEYYKELAKKQADWSLGALEALHNYYDEAQDVAGQVAQAFSRGLDSATDALVNFVRTGKLDFRSLVDSILADLLRIQLKKSIATVLNSALGGVLGGLFGAGAGTLSGSSGVGSYTPGSGSGVIYAASGTNYIEKDNQLAILHKGEAVIPRAYNPAAGGMAGGAGVNINIKSEVNAAAGTNPAQISAFIDQRDAQLKAEIYNNFRRGRWAGAIPAN
jgi:lambda family phage tail tape measure protein